MLRRSTVALVFLLAASLVLLGASASRSFYVIPAAGGEPRLLGEGGFPAISPSGDRVVFIREEKVWWAPLDGSEKASQGLPGTRRLRKSPLVSGRHAARFRLASRRPQLRRSLRPGGKDSAIPRPERGPGWRACLVPGRQAHRVPADSGLDGAADLPPAPRRAALVDPRRRGRDRKGSRDLPRPRRPRQRFPRDHLPRPALLGRRRSHCLPLGEGRLDSSVRGFRLGRRPGTPDAGREYDPVKRADAARLAFRSSPMAGVESWRSPVLVIHGDDDRNVPFQQSVGLAEALRARGVKVEQLVFPDEVHDFLLQAHWIEAYRASAEFLDRHLRAGKGGGGEKGSRVKF